MKFQRGDRVRVTRAKGKPVGIVVGVSEDGRVASVTLAASLEEYDARPVPTGLTDLDYKRVPDYMPEVEDLVVLQPNVRFWVYWKDGWVRLTLAPGQTLSCFEGGPDEEGWWSNEQEYSYDDAIDGVYRTQTVDGSDCDGRLTNTDEFYCGTDNLGADARLVGVPREIIRVPIWERIGGRVFDANAVAAGY